MLWICLGRRRFRRCSHWKTPFRTSRVQWRGDAPPAGDRRPRPDDRDVATGTSRSSTTSRAAAAGIRARSAKNGTRAAPQVRPQCDEAAEALGQEETLPDLVVLDLHFALRRRSSCLGTRTASIWRRSAAPRASTSSSSCARTIPPCRWCCSPPPTASIERPQHPLVHFCENEVVDSRTLAAEVSRALALQHAAQEGPVFWGRFGGNGRACAARSRSWPEARCRC